MFLRFALCIGIAAAVTVAGPHPSRAQQSQTPPPAPATKPDATTPTYKAMKLYRNYDGAKSTFGDTSISAVTPNPDNVAAFAAVLAVAA